MPNADLIPPPPLADDRVGLRQFLAGSTRWKSSRRSYFTTSDRQLAGQEPLPGEEVFESFSARALEKLGHARGRSARSSATSNSFQRRDDAYPPRPLYEVFDPKLWHANYGDGAFFKDKIVIVGASAQIAHDFVATPMSPDTPGPALHLHAMAAAIDARVSP